MNDKKKKKKEKGYEEEIKRNWKHVGSGNKNILRKKQKN